MVHILAAFLIAGGPALGEPIQYQLEARILTVPTSAPLAAVCSNPVSVASAELQDDLMKTDGVEVLSAPRVVTRAGQEAVIQERESIPGVSLEVGRPITQNQSSIQSQVVIALDQWVLLGGHSRTQDVLAILVRVTAPPAE